MKSLSGVVALSTLLFFVCAAYREHDVVKVEDAPRSTGEAVTDADVSQPASTSADSARSHRLHGYIGFVVPRPPAGSNDGAGVGFYSAVWPLLDQPVANLQIGLASCWILPNNSDNTDRPLAPQGTLART